MPSGDGSASQRRTVSLDRATQMRHSCSGSPAHLKNLQLNVVVDGSYALLRKPLKCPSWLQKIAFSAFLFLFVLRQRRRCRLQYLQTCYGFLKRTRKVGLLTHKYKGRNKHLNVDRAAGGRSPNRGERMLCTNLINSWNSESKPVLKRRKGTTRQEMARPRTD